MSDHTGRHRAVARAVTLALWGVGSAYLVKTELGHPEPDYVVVVATPIVWAVVIALPILAAYARRDRQWLAAGLIWLAAAVGATYTLQGTLGRQAEARDVLVERAAELQKQRKRIERDLIAAREMLAAARAKCGQGRECLPATRATIGVYEGAVVGHETRLSRLETAAPAAGEKRIAALLSFATGADVAAASEIVGLVVPALFGLTLELAAFAVAMLGWHPQRRRFPENERFPAHQASVAAPEIVVGQHPVIAALRQVGRPVNNNELAALMSVCAPESSKRRKEVAHLLREIRVGKNIMVSLA